MPTPHTWTSLRADIAEMIGEQKDFSELLLQLTRRDLLLRYKQTLMGFGWALLNPLLNTAIFSVIFMRVAPLETPVPYPLFVYTGMLAWNLTAAALRVAVTSLTANTTLVTKVYFPREIFPFAAVAVSAFDTLVASTVVMALMAWYRVGPSPALLWLPLVLAVQVMFTAALALVLAMANLFYRDVKYLFEVALSVWMFASAIVFPPDAAGGGVTGMLLQLNPMTAIVDAWRQTLLYGHAPSTAFVGVALGTLLFLPAAWLLFHRSEFRFAEHI